MPALLGRQTNRLARALLQQQLPFAGRRWAYKGERRRALTDTDAAGASGAGCSASAASPLVRGDHLNQH